MQREKSISAGIIDQRIANMARIRILAAFGIVWFHTEHSIGRDIGYAGLPVFLMVSCSLIAVYSYSYNINEFLTRRAKRLLAPWIFWSAVYVIFKFADSARKREVFWDQINLSMLVTGSSIHLWYLPYAFVAAILVYVLIRLTLKKMSFLTILAASCIGAGFVFASSVIMSKYSTPTPLGQWLFALGAIPVGFAFGCGCHLEHRSRQIFWFVAIALAVLIACAALHILKFTHLVVPYSVAAVLLCAAHIWHGKLDGFSGLLDSMTYGIYLVHPLVMKAINVLYDLGPMPWVNIVLTFVLSAVLVYIIKMTFLRRFV